MDADGNGGEWNDDLLVTHGPSYYTNALMELIKDYQSRCGATKVVLAGCSAGGYMTMRFNFRLSRLFCCSNTNL